jgi:raffinose/stachyose/melibiose transport system substrate-binding protein
MENLLNKKIIRTIIIILVVILLCLGAYVGYRNLSDYIKNKWSVQDIEAQEVEGNVTLKIVYAPMNAYRNTVLEQMVEQFEEDNPDISITLLECSKDGLYDDVLRNLYARDNLGDIVELISPADYVDNGVLLPMPDDLKTLTDYTFSKDGISYALPTAEYTTGIVYNKQIFKRLGLQIPQTYQEFLELCEKIKQEGLVPLSVGGRDKWHYTYLVDHFFAADILSSDAQWVSRCNAGEVSWLDSNARAMISDINSLFAGGYVNDDYVVTSDTGAIEKLYNGEVVMTYADSLLIGELTQQVEDSDTYGFFVLPAANGTKVAELYTESYWAMTKECKSDITKMAAAKRFLKYFYSDEIYVDLIEKNCTLPTIEKVKEELTYPAIVEEIKQDLINADQIVTYRLGDQDTPPYFKSMIFREIEKMAEGNESVEDVYLSLNREWKINMGGMADNEED